jgi:alpha-L-rhamnosidase
MSIHTRIMPYRTFSFNLVCRTTAKTANWRRLMLLAISFLACALVAQEIWADGNTGITDAEMQAVYDEVKTPHKYGIVIRGGEGELVDCPNVFRRGDKWYMTYVASKDKIGYETYLAESDDLLEWKPLGKILPFPKSGWDRWQADGSIALVDPVWKGSAELQQFDGKYWMSYFGGDKQGYETDPLSIGLAWTTTPTKVAPWNRLAENPVLTPSQSDARPFEKATLYKSQILWDRTETLGYPFVMFYNGKQQGRGTERIGMAVSNDMVAWRRLGDGPVIDNGTGISGDPQIVRMGDVWVMFYFGAFWKPAAFDTFACSRDLVHWTKWDGPHLIEPSEPWDKTFAHKPWVLKHDGVVYHFYCAVGNEGRAIALATSKDMRAARVSLRPAELKCEYAVDPMGVDVAKPRLSWTVESSERGANQSAYRVLVASTPELLSQDNGDLWDSGKVESDETTRIAYAGLPLASSLRAHWKVRVWDADDKPSPWSAPAEWTMGVMRPNDWKAKWIVAPWSSESILLRREFMVRPGLTRAIAHICGLGQFEMSVNGKKSGDHLLAPGWTKYNRTALYETHDITPLLKVGDNAVGLVLGDGMYHTERRNRFSKFQGTFGPQRAFGQIELEYDDGSREIIATDEDWRVSSGPVTYNDIFGGEDYDARKAQPGWDTAGFDDATWVNAVELVRPSGTLRGLSASAPPLKAIEAIRPVSIKPLSEALDVVDFGQNASFMPKIRVTGPAGSTVRLTHAEVLGRDGNINRGTCGGNRGPAYWQYTKATDDPETWFPQFFYAGCRYLQADKIPAEPGGDLPRIDSIEGVVVHSDAEPIGEFECSNELLNRIRTLVRWAQRSNMVSVLTDCPHREKLGWLEQYHLNGPAIRYEFDVNRTFNKGMRDMADSQTDDGLIPNIAPEYTVFPGTFRAAAEWGCAFIFVPWQQYQFTGDTSLMREYYGEMQKYMKYLESRATDHIVDEGLGDWYDLGPADRPGFAQLTPPPVTATAFYYFDAHLMSQIAEILDKTEDAKEYSELAESIRTAWQAKFRNVDSGTYATNSQCSNAIALVMELAEEEDREQALAALVSDVESRGNAMTAGDVGFRYLLQALAEGGRSDVIYAMINQDERPGYGYQLKKGATSLTEAWDANHHASHNHFMLGHITEWFYKDLVGIDSDPAAPGFKNIIIRPTPVGDLTWAEATYRSVRGPISVRWERDGDGFRLQVEVPANTRATVYLPASEDGDVTESGVDVGEAPHVKFLRREGDRNVYAVESGSYDFHSQM